MWRLLFAIVLHANSGRMASVRLVLVDLLPFLLPCESCRAHFARNKPVVTRRAKGAPTTAQRAYLWLYYLKDEVNKSMTPPVVSPSFAEVQARYALYDGCYVGDVEIADLFVLIAIEAAKSGREAHYTRFCSAVAVLLPPDVGCILPELMAGAPQFCSVTVHALQMAQAVRRSRGIVQRPLRHYATLGEI